MLMLPALALTVAAVGVCAYLTMDASDTRSLTRVFVPQLSSRRQICCCGDIETVTFATQGKPVRVPISQDRLFVNGISSTVCLSNSLATR